MYNCELCGATFIKNQGLSSHKRRKRPCKPVLSNDDLNSTQKECPYKCLHCNRVYSRADSLTRHTKTCKAANDAIKHDNEDVESKLLAMEERLTSAMTKQVEKIDQMLTNLTTSTTDRPVVVTAIQQNNVINIHPWDGDKCIVLDVEKIVAAFTENTRLQEYANMGDYAMATQSISSPYVMDILMDLTRRAHEDPASRNVYLNPSRADQVLAWMKDGHWEVLPFHDVTRTILDGVSGWMHIAALSHEMVQVLPLDARNALAIADSLYKEEPDKYAIKAKGPMMAHLTNCREKILRKTDIQCEKLIATSTALSAASIAAPTAARMPLCNTIKSRYGELPAHLMVVEQTLNEERAAAALQKMPPVGSVTIEYIKKLASTAGAEPDYLIKKLWEAMDGGLFDENDAKLATDIIAKYDEDPKAY